MTGLLLTLVLVPVFWLFIVRPQQKRQREHLAVVSSLTVGQQVMSVGGIIGTVTAVDDDTVRVEVAPGVELTLGRTFVRQRIEDEAAPAAEATEAGTADLEVEDPVTLTKDGSSSRTTEAEGGPA